MIPVETKGFFIPFIGGTHRRDFFQTIASNRKPYPLIEKSPGPDGGGLDAKPAYPREMSEICLNTFILQFTASNDNI
jgi:hypothetical protein